MLRIKPSRLSLLLVSVMSLAAPGTATRASDQLLMNASYDPTREFYKDYNSLFKKHWASRTGNGIAILQSHAGSAKQAQSVIDGLAADVVTLATSHDIDQIRKKSHLIGDDWQSRLPHNSSPYTSTVVFVVRKGNPLKIRDWGDLVKPDVSIVTPNPKSSGGGRWNYLAAWAYAIKAKNDESEARKFMAALYGNAPVLDSGARGSTMTFTRTGIGDVLITWENEAYAITRNGGKHKYEVVEPSISILAEPAVSVVDAVARKHGSTELARAYLEYLYSAEAQELIAHHFYRPRDPKVRDRYARRFPSLKLYTVDEVAGGWEAAASKHFDNGGLFDRINNDRD